MMTDNHKALVERVRPALKLLDGLEIGQRCEEYAYAEANSFQAITHIPEAFEALRALPGIIAALQSAYSIGPRIDDEVIDWGGGHDSTQHSFLKPADLQEKE